MQQEETLQEVINNKLQAKVVEDDAGGEQTYGTMGVGCCAISNACHLTTNPTILRKPRDPPVTLAESITKDIAEVISDQVPADDLGQPAERFQRLTSKHRLTEEV